MRKILPFEPWSKSGLNLHLAQCLRRSILLPHHSLLDPTTIPEYGHCNYEISCDFDTDLTSSRCCYSNLEVLRAPIEEGMGL